MHGSAEEPALYPADSDGGSRERKLNLALVRQMAVVEREAPER